MNTFLGRDLAVTGSRTRENAMKIFEGLELKTDFLGIIWKKVHGE